MGDALAPSITRFVCVCVCVIRWLGGSLPEAEAGNEWVPEDQAAGRDREKQQHIFRQHLLRYIFIHSIPHVFLFFIVQRSNPCSYCSTVINMLHVKLWTYFLGQEPEQNPLSSQFRTNLDTLSPEKSPAVSRSCRCPDYIRRFHLYLTILLSPLFWLAGTRFHQQAWAARERGNRGKESGSLQPAPHQVH